MSGPARVHSIEALEQLAGALAIFTEAASAVLADLGMDLNRAVQWLEHDQPEYWKAQLRRAEQQVEEARLNLERKRMYRVGDQEPPCREERMALEAAKRRAERAREKLEACRHWARIVEHEVVECQAAVGPLAAWIQTEAPKAHAALKQMGGALESYVQIHAPESSAAPPAAEETQPPSEDKS